MIKKTIVALYLVVIVVMAVATIVEKFTGTPYVGAYWYGSWWFSLLWALLTVASVLFFVQRKVKNWFVLLLHGAFVVILLGAFITHVTSWQGRVHLSMNETVDYCYIMDGDEQVHRMMLPFKMSLYDFQMNYYPESMKETQPVVSDYITRFMIDYKVNAEVSMNKVFDYRGVRFFQSDYDPDGRGSVLALTFDPYGRPVTYAGYALLFLSLLIMPFRGNRGQRITSAVCFAGVAVLIAILKNTHFGQTDSQGYIVPVLNSPYFSVHVGILMVAYTLLFVDALLGIAYFVCHHESLYKWSHRLLLPAMSFLGAGIFIGAIWANVSWGTYWSWDAKETWALITLMLYAVPLHPRLIKSMARPRSYHLFMALAILTIVITFFGVNYFLTGMHSYM